MDLYRGGGPRPRDENGPVGLGAAGFPDGLPLTTYECPEGEQGREIHQAEVERNHQRADAHVALFESVAQCGSAVEGELSDEGELIKGSREEQGVRGESDQQEDGN